MASALRSEHDTSGFAESSCLPAGSWHCEQSFSNLAWVRLQSVLLSEADWVASKQNVLWVDRIAVDMESSSCSVFIGRTAAKTLVGLEGHWTVNRTSVRSNAGPTLTSTVSTCLVKLSIVRPPGRQPARIHDGAVRRP
jgi:hypothetical protein